MATLKQKAVAKKLVEKGVSVSRAMREVGYSENTARDPSKVTNSKGFKELLAELGVTDEKLGQVLNEGLEATKVVVMGKESSESYVDVQPDHPTRHKFLETGLRLRGYAKDDAPNININFINKIPRPNDGYSNTESKPQSEAD